MHFSRIALAAALMLAAVPAFAADCKTSLSGVTACFTNVEHFASSGGDYYSLAASKGPSATALALSIAAADSLDPMRSRELLVSINGRAPLHLVAEWSGRPNCRGRLGCRWSNSYFVPLTPAQLAELEQAQSIKVSVGEFGDVLELSPAALQRMAAELKAGGAL